MIAGSGNQAIVLFDGLCNYCSGWVDFIMKHDGKGYFKFAAIQSQAGKNILTAKNISQENLPDSVILIEKENVYFRSDAGLRIQRKLSFPFPALYLLIIFPRFIRDAVYDFIANNRYKWFGKRKTCRMPVSEIERNKFLS